MSPEESAKLEEIHRLLEEAYSHYFEYEGHSKISEGFISVEYGTLWDRRESECIQITNVHIYSYVFCKEGRSQDFGSLDEALMTVREWHAEEMAYDYTAPEEVEAREKMDKMAFEFIEGMKADGRLTIIEIGEGEDG
jgi:hypothetical protein